MRRGPSSCVSLQVMEGQPAGSLLGTVQAKDPDEGENGIVFYSLSGGKPTVYPSAQCVTRALTPHSV